MPPGAPRAAVVLSGNELLDGRTRDTNGAFVCHDLSGRGVKVTELLTVADDAALLTAALRHVLAAGPDLLVVGGGLGTTHDDLTAECLARGARRPARGGSGGARLRRGQRERPSPSAVTSTSMRCSALARRQAMLPAGSTPVPPAGVAPGIAATSGTTRVFAYPGRALRISADVAGDGRRPRARGLLPGRRRAHRPGLRCRRAAGGADPGRDAARPARAGDQRRRGRGDGTHPPPSRPRRGAAGRGRRRRPRGRRARVLHRRSHRGRHHRRRPPRCAGRRSPSPSPAPAACSARASPRGRAVRTTSSAASSAMRTRRRSTSSACPPEMLAQLRGRLRGGRAGDGGGSAPRAARGPRALDHRRGRPRRRHAGEAGRSRVRRAAPGRQARRCARAPSPAIATACASSPRRRLSICCARRSPRERRGVAGAACGCSSPATCRATSRARSRHWQDRELRPHRDLRLAPTLHLTLAFLGNVAADRVPELERVLQAIDWEPARCTFKEPLFLPAHGKRRVVALELDDPSGTLRRLQERGRPAGSRPQACTSPRSARGCRT